MMALFGNALIYMLEKHLNTDMSYMKMLNAASPKAFRNFVKVASLGGSRQVVPVAASHAARLAGVAFEDCGPCVQIVIDQARAKGVDEAIILAVLAADVAHMPDDVALAYSFACGILTRSADLDEVREAVRARWGDKGVVDLTLATQINRLYPMIKLGLGFAQSCQQVSVVEKRIKPAIETR